MKIIKITLIALFTFFSAILAYAQCGPLTIVSRLRASSGSWQIENRR